MENIEFIKSKTRFNDDEKGVQLKQVFQSIEPIIVPIFDGVTAMHPTSREWLASEYPDLLTGLDGPPEADKVQVRVASARWWYHCPDVVEAERSTEDVENGKRATNDVEMVARGSVATSSYMHFQLIPIVKRTNHRKHNSHHWFFQGIAAGVNASMVFLTDCGTSYKNTCLASLVYALKLRPDLIGVTARQRVETPNMNYHPCESTPISFLQGSHAGLGSEPCWKCWASYLLSPALLQGFEFEATLVLNSALFNLVEAMPVLPGPCQLLDWQRMRKHRVVEEYFSLLFKEEGGGDTPSVSHSGAPVSKGLPLGYKKMSSAKTQSADSSLKERLVSDASISSEFIGGIVTDSQSNGFNSEHDLSVRNFSRVPPSLLSDDATVETWDSINIRHSAAEVGSAPAELSWTEFLRVNMRLAEDRVLSFVTVFSTGYGTKWIPGSTFFYEPEISFRTLLTQRYTLMSSPNNCFCNNNKKYFPFHLFIRRRWINGTVCSFMYFFSSIRARDRIQGGFFDSHKAGKSKRLVDLLWSLCLVQFLFTLVSPAVFAVALYTALERLSHLRSDFEWTEVQYIQIGGGVHINGGGICVIFFLLVYTFWVINAYRAKVTSLFAAPVN
jgi:hypothetical protein